MKKRIAAAALVLMMTLGAVGCGQKAQDTKTSASSQTESSQSNTQEQDQNNSEESNISTTSTADGGADALANPNITIIRPTITKDDPSAIGKAIRAYEERYGSGTITIVNSDWSGNKDMKIIAGIASGNPIDAVFTMTVDMPKYYTQGMLQPLDDYLEIDPSRFDVGIMDAGYKYEGKYYAASPPDNAMVWYIFYNKTMFENNGVKTPREYLNDGSLTWDAVKEMGMKFSKDTNSDGIQDQFGFTQWSHYVWPYQNDSSIVTIDSKGQANLNLDDPKFSTAFNFVHDAITKDKWMTVTDPYGTFEKGNAAMMMERSFYGRTLTEKGEAFPYEWDVVTLPKGPDATSAGNNAGGDGWGIGAGSKNPEGAAAFINLLMDQHAAERDVSRSFYTDEQWEMFAKDRENVSVVFDEGVIKDKFWDFMNAVSSEDPVSSSIEKFKPVFQAQVDKANTKIDMNHVKEFAGFDTIDFEDGSVDLFKWFDPEKTDGMSYSITDDPSEAISGKSMKLSIDSSVTGEWADAIYTDPAVLEIPGFHDYKISFDYKLTGSLNSDNDGYYAVAIKGPDGGFGYQRFTQSDDEPGQVYHFEADISITSLDAKDIGIFFAAHFGSGDVIIDNINIAQAE